MSSWWNLETSGWAKLLLAAGALVLVGWAEWARRRTPDRDRSGARWRPRLLGILGVLGFVAYFNFGSFNFLDSYLHRWDAAHYVLAAVSDPAHRTEQTT